MSTLAVKYSWKVSIGVPTIDRSDCTKIIKESNMFLYFGHGNGMQYYKGESIAKSKIKTGCMIIGCSSAYV